MSPTPEDFATSCPLAVCILDSFRSSPNFLGFLASLLSNSKLARQASRSTKNPVENATLTRTSTTTTSLYLYLWMARSTNDDAKRPAPSSAAKREAQARYRERNRDELRRKAREGMARRRARLSPEEALQYRITAREDGARYRAENQAMLAQRAFPQPHTQICHARRESIARLGYEAWSAKYRKRHERPIPAVLEAEFGAPAPPNTPEAPVNVNAPSETSEPPASSASFAPRSRLPACGRDALSRMTESVRKLGSSGLFDVGPPPADFFCLGPPLDLACSGLEGEERRRRRRVGIESSHVRVRAWLPTTDDTDASRDGLADRVRAKELVIQKKNTSMYNTESTSTFQEIICGGIHKLGLPLKNLEGGTQQTQRRARAKTHLLVFKICLVPRFLAQQARKPPAETLFFACSATRDPHLLEAAVAVAHLVAQGAARGVVPRASRDLRRAGCRRGSGGVEVQSAESLDDVLRTRAIFEVERPLLVEVAVAAASAAGGARGEVHGGQRGKMEAISSSDAVGTPADREITWRRRRSSSVLALARAAGLARLSACCALRNAFMAVRRRWSNASSGLSDGGLQARVDELARRTTLEGTYSVVCDMGERMGWRPRGGGRMW
ncbi:hypothetical protein DFH06DRAFT_1126172 [Mycena polygramma]|nr:hypothetical protein DFH06DRAFT_1126172 [Mycena polygramma]